MPKTILTPHLHSKIVSLVKKGNYASTAAIAAGVSQSSYHHWVGKGRKIRQAIDTGEIHDPADAQKQAGGGDQQGGVSHNLTENELIYLKVYDDVTRAKATAEAYAVECLRDGFGDPRMAIEYLKRTNPKAWGSTQTLDVHDSRAAQHEAKRTRDKFSQMSDAELLEIIADERLQATGASKS
eukprot:GHVR01074532.1.p1 GENE.GHVR01074532.1~~GHVR01074532.1.p1  ORF type:complete len:182 (+),score=19.09 GHVR01074532.1:359-904(+)